MDPKMYYFEIVIFIYIDILNKSDVFESLVILPNSLIYKNTDLQIVNVHIWEIKMSRFLAGLPNEFLLIEIVCFNPLCQLVDKQCARSLSLSQSQVFKVEILLDCCTCVSSTWLFYILNRQTLTCPCFTYTSCSPYTCECPPYCLRKWSLRLYYLSLSLSACLSCVISKDIWATSPPCVMEQADPDSLPPEWAMWRVAYFLHSPTPGNKTVRKKVKDTATGAARSEAREVLILYQRGGLHLAFFFLSYETLSQVIDFFHVSLGLSLLCFIPSLLPRYSFITFPQRPQLSPIFHG